MAQDLTNIKSGSIVFVWGHSLLSKVIRYYQKWDTKIGDTPTHVEIYFGSGKNECVSAEAGGVDKVDLKRHFGKKVKVEVYSYNNLTINQLQRLKSFAYSRVKIVPYDFLGLVSFAGRFFGMRKVPHFKFANFCNELVADVFNSEDILVDGKNRPSNEQHPADLWLYIKDSKKWNLDFKYEK